MESIMHAADAIERELKSRFQIGWTSYQILKVLIANGGRMRIGGITAAVGIAASTTTTSLDLLERDGWIERVRAKDDRRVVNVEVLHLSGFAEAEAFMTGEAPDSVKVHLHGLSKVA